METTPQQNTAQTENFEEQQIDLRKYLALLLKRKWIILITFALVVSAVTTWTLRQRKIYSASCSLVIDAQLPQVLGEVREAVEVGSGSYWYNKEFYETQYKIIKSRAVVQRVVEQLGLDSDPSFLGLDGLEASALPEALEKADAVAVLQKRLFIEPIKDSRVVNVRVEDVDPERAATLANSIANSFMQANIERRVDGTKDAAEWLQDQLADLRSKLAESEFALYTFKKSNDLVYTTLENKQTITSQKLVAVNEALTRVRMRKAELDARVKAIASAKSSGDSEQIMRLGIVASNQFVNELKKNYLNAKNEIADLDERYGAEHPKMRAAREKLANASQALTSAVESIVASSLAEYKELLETERGLGVMLEDIKREAFETNKKEIDYKRLAREEENNQRLFELVLKRTKELDLSSLLKTNNIRILDKAKSSSMPFKPRVRMNLLLAIAFGLLAGLGVALLAEMQDRTVRGHQDIESLGVAFLGVVPSIHTGSSEPAGRDLFVADQPKSSVAECCRTIRTNLLFTSAERQAARIVVTSANPQEGKTTTLINLGITLARAGGRVLLVDSDMRRPRLHKSLGVPNDVGLSSLIVGEGDFRTAIKETRVPGLYVLPSGPIPPNPAELLHTDRFRSLAKLLGEEYDRVLFDSPPVGAVADPLVLANEVEGVVLVVKMLRTERESASRAAKALRDAGGRLMGAVLNDVPIDKRGYGYHLGYYSYGNYYEAEGERS